MFEHRGNCYRGGISLDALLGRYLWCQILPGANPGFDPESPSKDPRFEGGLGIYAVPEPWGPWTTVYLTEK